MWGVDGWPGHLWTQLVAKALHHWPIAELGEFSVVDVPGVRFDAIDTWMVHQVFWFGKQGYEPGEADQWVASCRRAERIVEIGANVGWYTVLGASANRSAEYVAVEPQPRAAQSLRRNLELNNLSNVEVVEAAVVGEGAPATISLNFPDATLDNPAPGRAFVSGAEFELLPAHTSITVPTVQALDVIGGADLLKLDIEGLEADVLGAAEEAIAVARPTIFLEVQPEAEQLHALIARWEVELGYAVRASGERDFVLEPRA